MSTTNQMRLLVGSWRVHQWIKNLFVLAPLLFGRQLLDPVRVTQGTLAFFAFCFAASAVYLLNDLIDIEKDRAHPDKRRRPLASGALSARDAYVGMACLVVAALACAAATGNWGAAAVIAGYMLMNVAYSFMLKGVVILDVMLIAAGFILRILAGSFAVEVKPSFWLVLCTLTVSLFLGFTKRRAELVKLEHGAVNHRAVLNEYSPMFLDQMIAIVTSTTLVCYIMYTIDVETVELYGTRALVMTVPFVLYGVFRYLYLVYQRHEGGSPTRAILFDWPFLLNIGLWGFACLVLVYWGPTVSAWLPW